LIPLPFHSELEISGNLIFFCIYIFCDELNNRKGTKKPRGPSELLFSACEKVQNRNQRQGDLANKRACAGECLDESNNE
jgi:hypothetical protein